MKVLLVPKYILRMDVAIIRKEAHIHIHMYYVLYMQSILLPEIGLSQVE